MGAIASQITSLAIIYWTVYSDADQRKKQSSASLAFVRGIHRGPVNSPHKWPVTRKMFPFDDVIMVVPADSLATGDARLSAGTALKTILYIFQVLLAINDLTLPFIGQIKWFKKTDEISRNRHFHGWVIEEVTFDLSFTQRSVKCFGLWMAR